MGEKKFAGALALAMIVFAVIMEIYSYKVIPDIEVGVSSFNDNWTIKEENGESVQVTLPVKRQVPAGQELVLENRIPDKFYMNGGIVFRSRQQEVEVYMEEELLYKYPEKELIGQSLPGNWNFVMLPKDCEGKTLTVKIRSPYQKFSGQIGEIYYGNYSELLDFIIKKQTPIFRMGILIGIAGAVIEVLAVVLRKYRIYSYQELLALCVDRRGGSLTIWEAVDKLWEGREYDDRVKNLYRKAIMNLRQTFAEHGLADVFSNNRGECSIDCRKVDCDYYRLLEGDETARRAWMLTKEYMGEYSWAEETQAVLLSL